MFQFSRIFTIRETVTVTFIKRAKDELPEELKTFLNLVLSGNGPEMDKCEKIH